MENKELIQIQINDNMEQVVSGRELHKALGIETQYSIWFDRMRNYGFVENVDFIPVNQKRLSGGITGITTITDHIMQLNMAKEIAMIQRSPTGKKIRQYFINIEKQFNDPDRIIQRALIFSQKKIEKLEQKIKEDTPRVSFAETIEKSSDSILIREFAKMIANEGIDMGEKKLYRWLREKGYILKFGTEPSQKAVELGLFKVTTHIVKSIKGDIQTNTTKVTGKGQIYLLEKIKKETQYNMQCSSILYN